MSFKQREIAEYIRLLLDRTKDLDEQVEVLQLMESAGGDALPPFGGGHTALHGVFGVPVEVISYTSSTGFMGARQAPVSTTELAEDPNLKEIPVEAFNGIDTMPVIGKTVIAEFIGTTGGAAAAVYGFFGTASPSPFYIQDGVGGTEQAVSHGQTITFVSTSQDGVYGLICHVTPTRKVWYRHANTSSQPTIAASTNRFISAVALDTYGHVTSLTLAAITTVSSLDEKVALASGETATYLESLLNNPGTYVAADDIPIKWQRIDGAITFFIDASTDTTTGCT